jgi:hypothetical protein
MSGDLECSAAQASVSGLSRTKSPTAEAEPDSTAERQPALRLEMFAGQPGQAMRSWFKLDDLTDVEFLDVTCIGKREQEH